MTIEIAYTGLLVYMLVFVRLAGMILLNPLFGRSNVPNIARMGLILCLTLMIAPMQSMNEVLAMSGVEYALAAVRELCIGAVYAFIFRTFYFLLYFSGDVMDTDFGLSMAKTFDPSTNIQASFSSTLVSMLFALYIFATGSHLTLIHMFADSFNLIPLGAGSLTVNIVSFALDVFSSAFILVIRLAAPFTVAEFVLQCSMGILMKFIPQITVFVINFQLRILLGLIMLFLFAPYVGQFVDNYITVLFDDLVEATRVMMG